jgi:hypothetical protein
MKCHDFSFESPVCLDHSKKSQGTVLTEHNSTNHPVFSMSFFMNSMGERAIPLDGRKANGKVRVNRIATFSAKDQDALEKNQPGGRHQGRGGRVRTQKGDKSEGKNCQRSRCHLDTLKQANGFGSKSESPNRGESVSQARKIAVI